MFAPSSIGIGLGDARSKTPEALLMDADTAMYRAKEEGTTFRVFDPHMYARAKGAWSWRLTSDGLLRLLMSAYPSSTSQWSIYPTARS